MSVLHLSWFMQMRMKRLAFVLPGGEAWVRRLAEDLISQARSLDMECLFFSQGPAPRDLDGVWIELDRLHEIPGLDRLISLQPEPEISESVLDREYRYHQARFGGKFSAEDVEKRYALWINQARALYRLTMPDMVWVWNGTVYRSAAYAAAAMGMDIPLRFAEKGVMPGSWALDPRGTNGESSLLDSDESFPGEDAVTSMKTIIRGWDDMGSSAWGQPDRLAEKERNDLLAWAAGRKIVFFPGQVDSDSNIICFSPHFRGSLEALNFLVKNLNDEYVFLVKPHPKGSAADEAYRRAVGGRGRVMTNIHVLDAIALSDLVVTINSTVGFEAAVRGKPVFLLGRGILSGRSFVRGWKPGQPLAEQITSWLESYRRSRERMARGALSWASGLHREYYMFIGDRPRLRARLTREIESTRGEGSRRLDIRELEALLIPGSPAERCHGVPTRQLAGLTGRKLLRRIFNTKKQ